MAPRDLPLFLPVPADRSRPRPAGETLGPATPPDAVRREAERRARDAAASLERVLRLTSGLLNKTDSSGAAAAQPPTSANSVATTHATAAVRRLFADFEYSGVPMSSITELVIRYGAPRVAEALKASAPFRMSHGRLFRAKAGEPIAPAETTTAGALTDAVVSITGVAPPPVPDSEGVKGPDRMPDPPLSKSEAAAATARSYAPPAGARSAARRGLELRKEWKRGGLSNAEAGAQGIGSGVQRASDLANGEKMSLSTVRRMHAFFERHQKNYAPGKKDDDGGPTAGTIAWLLWGGNAARSWARGIVEAAERDAKGGAEKALSAMAGPPTPNTPYTGQQFPVGYGASLDGAREYRPLVVGRVRRRKHTGAVPMFKSEKEVEPRKEIDDDPRSDPIGTRKIWNKRVVQKMNDGKWHVVGPVAGLEDPGPVTQLDVKQLTREDLAHLMRQLLKLKEVRSQMKW